MITHIRTIHPQLFISCIPNSFSTVQKLHMWNGRDVDIWVRAMHAAGPELPLTLQTSLFWWIKRILYSLWSCWVLASHAPLHCSFLKQPSSYYQGETTWKACKEQAISVDLWVCLLHSTCQFTLSPGIWSEACGRYASHLALRGHKTQEERTGRDLMTSSYRNKGYSSSSCVII